MAVKLTTRAKSALSEWAIEVQDEGDGGIEIKAVNGDAEWYLLKIKADGTFSRYLDISEDTGFKVTQNGMLKETLTED